VTAALRVYGDRVRVNRVVGLADEHGAEPASVGFAFRRLEREVTEVIEKRAGVGLNRSDRGEHLPAVGFTDDGDERAGVNGGDGQVANVPGRARFPAEQASQEAHRSPQCAHFASTASTLLPPEKAKPPRLRGFSRWAVLGSNQ
jgi:hypothetical protein